MHHGVYEEQTSYQEAHGWLAQTTHPGLAVAHSVMSSMPPIAGVLEVAHCIYQWIQAHKQDGLISRAGDTSGFTFFSDSDWAGLHAITGEVRSRTEFLATFNGMPIDWYTGLQKTIVSNWTEEVPHSQHRAQMPRQWRQQTLYSGLCTCRTLPKSCNSTYLTH